MDAGPPDARLRARLAALFDDGWEIWQRFDVEVRQDAWHPFVPSDYDAVLEALLGLRGPGRRFLEWGSACGTITIMADLLGFESYGIELDPALVRVARDLAVRYESRARFAAGSFLLKLAHARSIIDNDHYCCATGILKAEPRPCDKE